mmetsp:Transcript_14724/g.19312  ORF Transcript_14724/g.19312 Transcript_14724/m.19312 type:complete len:809 (-) Transcript_14724:86-2512(-)|eukprot:CAMPEP_0184016816 /NCGR_PEP_ID=MMETSP0954-20121128/7144_1 /TAXON_ID=627963 /ORGANISM="Aplanochytrium sp, Strain PBS07" /LENGTH=808 /DNA_ID=CAMNT_0026297889 /DNA_START=310 /DNA_END=2739 /DNA_ORIENTATION=-
MISEEDNVFEWLMSESSFANGRNGVGNENHGYEPSKTRNNYNGTLERNNSLAIFPESSTSQPYSERTDSDAAFQRDSYGRQSYDAYNGGRGSSGGGGGLTPIDPNFSSFDWADAIITESPPQTNDPEQNGWQEVVQLFDTGLSSDADLSLDLDPLAHMNEAVPSKSIKTEFKNETVEDTSEHLSSPISLKSTGSPSSTATKPKRPLSPKSQKLREKNREAVRNCRKRKRERAEKLKEREEKLMKENEKLRLQLRLGTEELEKEVNKKTGVLVEKMSALLGKSSKTSETDKLITKTVEKYVSLYNELGRDREEAMKHITARLIRRTLPSQVTKMYLWQNAQSEEYFQLKDGLWKEMCARLGLTEDQVDRLVARRESVMQLCKQIAGMLYEIRKLHIVVMKKQRKAPDMQSLNVLSGVLTPVQMAKLLVFAHKDPRCANVSAQWDRYLKSYDEEIDGEIARGDKRWHFEVPGKEIKKTDDVQIKKNKLEDLKKARHKSALFMKELFEGVSEVSDQKLHKVFIPSIEMCDPNFRKPVKGSRKILEHVRRIKSAFENLRVSEDSFTVRENSNMARSRWSITGTYLGRQSKPKVTAEQSPKLGKAVEFRVIIAYKFENDSERIAQLVISWAALDLMRQLGLVSAELGKSKKVVETNYDVPTLSPKRMQELCIEFSGVFEIAKVEDRQVMAEKYLHNEAKTIDSNMGGQYEGAEGFVKYSEKLRRVFPEFKLMKHNFVPIKSKKPPVSNEPSVLKIQMGCLVCGIYKGALVQEPQPFKFSGEVFFSFDTESEKITEVVMNWNATSLMSQLGVKI